ncbi:MAG TPA: hypothetical protein VG013_15465 [Gemmataceae bacterium]|jgi:hypothetical protein|nr:hypothetical protein [Gemmataceae bacterium]
MMNIRTYQPGDEVGQAAIYNAAAADLPKFKPATVEEVRRRCQAANFDPQTRAFAEQGSRLLGYATFHPNGRVSYPWCLPGFEAAAEPLFRHVLEAMRRCGLHAAFAAYRGDWPVQQAFFLERGFRLAREMLNFRLELHEMTTRVVKASFGFSSLRREDIAGVRALAPTALRTTSDEELERHWLHNPHFPGNAFFVLRTTRDKAPVAAGILIQNADYADVRAVDAAMPCFRLGAFGTEGMQTKRLNGLFSFLARDDANLMTYAAALHDQAACRLERMEGAALAAQVPSDAPHLVRFYKQRFRQQAGFPILERTL